MTYSYLDLVCFNKEWQNNLTYVRRIVGKIRCIYHRYKFMLISRISKVSIIFSFLRFKTTFHFPFLFFNVINADYLNPVVESEFSKDKWQWTCNICIYDVSWITQILPFHQNQVEVQKLIRYMSWLPTFFNYHSNLYSQCADWKNFETNFLLFVKCKKMHIAA